MNKKIAVLSDIDKTLKFRNQPDACISNPIVKHGILEILQNKKFKFPTVIGVTGQSQSEFNYNRNKYNWKDIFSNDTPHILEDGSVLYNNNEIIIDKDVPMSDFNVIKKQIQSYGNDIPEHLMLYYRNTFQVNKDDLVGWSQLGGFDNPIIFQVENSIIPTIFIKGNEIDLKKTFGEDIFDKVCMYLNNELQLPGFSFVYCSNETIKLINNSMHKGKGIDLLYEKELLNVNDKILGFGDGINDIEFAKTVRKYGGAFIAVGNADEKLKQEASFVLSHGEIAAIGVKNGLNKVVEKSIAEIFEELLCISNTGCAISTFFHKGKKLVKKGQQVDNQISEQEVQGNIKTYSLIRENFPLLLHKDISIRGNEIIMPFLDNNIEERLQNGEKSVVYQKIQEYFALIIDQVNKPNDGGGLSEYQRIFKKRIDAIVIKVKSQEAKDGLHQITKQLEELLQLINKNIEPKVLGPMFFDFCPRNLYIQDGKVTFIDPRHQETVIGFPQISLGQLSHNIKDQQWQNHASEINSALARKMQITEDQSGGLFDLGTVIEELISIYLIVEKIEKSLPEDDEKNQKIKEYTDKIEQIFSTISMKFS